MHTNLRLGDARVQITNVERSRGKRGRRNSRRSSRGSGSSSSHVFCFFVLWFGLELFLDGSEKTCSGNKKIQSSGSQNSLIYSAEHRGRRINISHFRVNPYNHKSLSPTSPKPIIIKRIPMQYSRSVLCDARPWGVSARNKHHYLLFVFGWARAVSLAYLNILQLQSVHPATSATAAPDLVKIDPSHGLESPASRRPCDAVKISRAALGGGPTRLRRSPGHLSNHHCKLLKCDLPVPVLRTGNHRRIVE